MILFPLWLLKFLVFGGLVLCGLGALTLISFLISDLRKKQIW